MLLPLDFTNLSFLSFDLICSFFLYSFDLLDNKVSILDEFLLKFLKSLGFSLLDTLYSSFVGFLLAF